MSPKDAIRNTIGTSDFILNAYIGDLSDADLLVRPVPGMNHIAWQLGHLLAAEHRWAEILQPGLSPKLPEGFEDKYGKETAKSDDPKNFHTLAEYQALMKAQREATMKVLDAVDEATLDQPRESLPDYAKTPAALLNMIGIHPLMHCGQFVAVRRQLGKPVTI